MSVLWRQRMLKVSEILLFPTSKAAVTSFIIMSNKVLRNKGLHFQENNLEVLSRTI